MIDSKLSKLRKKYSYVLPSPPDSRDQMYISGSASPPTEASLREFRGDILNQGDWGSCTGHGTAGMINLFYKRLTGINVNFNPYWIWYWARKASGWEKQNIGAYPRDVFNMLIKKGVCEDRMWLPESYDESPPKLGEKDLVKFKGYKRFNFNKSDLNSIFNDFTYCIGVERLPIGITMAVHPSFETYTKETGKLAVPSADNPVIGHHWLYVDSVNSDGITLVNSWSPLWGDSGTCFMPWEYVENHVVEAWSLDPELP